MRTSQCLAILDTKGKYSFRHCETSCTHRAPTRYSNKVEISSRVPQFREFHNQFVETLWAMGNGYGVTIPSSSTLRRDKVSQISTTIGKHLHSAKSPLRSIGTIGSGSPEIPQRSGSTQDNHDAESEQRTWGRLSSSWKHNRLDKRKSGTSYSKREGRGEET